MKANDVVKKFLGQIAVLGGKARSASLTSEERLKIARNAAKARWSKKQK